MVRKVLSLQSNENDSHGESKIPLEQRITLMKVPQWVKDKAQSKLREVRSKSDDTGAKARQYLEGLVRIPFGDIREEPCLKLLETAHSHVKEVGKLLNVKEPLNYDQAEAVLTERAAEEVAVLASKLKRKTRDGLSDIAKELNLENPQAKNEGKGQVVGIHAATAAHHQLHTVTLGSHQYDHDIIRPSVGEVVQGDRHLGHCSDHPRDADGRRIGACFTRSSGMRNIDGGVVGEDARGKGQRRPESPGECASNTQDGF